MSELLRKRVRDDEALEDSPLLKKSVVSRGQDLDHTNFEDCLEAVAELLHAHEEFLSTWLGDYKERDRDTDIDIDKAYLDDRLRDMVVERTVVPALEQIRSHYSRVLETFIEEGIFLHDSQLALNVRLLTLTAFTHPSMNIVQTTMRAVTPIIPQDLLFLSPRLQDFLYDIRADTRAVLSRVRQERGEGPVLRLWEEIEADFDRNIRVVAPPARWWGVSDRAIMHMAVALTVIKFVRFHITEIINAIDELHQQSDITAQTEALLDERQLENNIRQNIESTGRVGHSVLQPINDEYRRITRSMTRRN